MTDYYTGKILKILTRQGASRRDVVALEMGIGVFDRSFTEAVDKLKFAGKIVETWSPASCGLLFLTKAPETAQDAPEAAKADMGSTEAVGCGTGQASRHVDIAIEAGSAVSILSEAYWEAINELSELRKENEQLRSKIAQTRDYSRSYYTLKEKLRGMLDAD